MSPLASGAADAATGPSHDMHVCAAKGLARCRFAARGAAAEDEVPWT
jgi:hypothetical protein